MRRMGADGAVKRIIVGATGASGLPILVKCLELIGEQPEYESYLIMSDSAVLTLGQETNLSAKQVEGLADHVLGPDEIGAGPASGSFATAGMLIVPCSMKTIAGIHSGYAENLILRAADVTIKEHRTLVLAARETPCLLYTSLLRPSSATPFWTPRKRCISASPPCPIAVCPVPFPAS